MGTINLLSKFKGAMLGALAGDCIGAKYEMMWLPVKFDELARMTEFLKGTNPSSGSCLLFYTDDTQMTHVLASSLISDKGFVAKNVAKRFSETYFSNKANRGYGAIVPLVFGKLRDADYDGDPYQPASEQFDGQGSFGNGSAMRVAPVALFCHADMRMLKVMAASSAKITHSHVDAVNGAILQAAAVELALSSDANVTWQDFWTRLKTLCDRMEAAPQNEKSKLAAEENVYSKKFDQIYQFLSEGNFSVEDIRQKIGVSVKAVEAVSAAIFSFLCCLANRQPIELESFGKLEQTVLYAISLGGDTDTIGTMAGAIAGAFYGAESVPDHWPRVFEGGRKAEELAASLHQAMCERVKGAEMI